MFWAFSSYSTFQSWPLYLVYDFRFVLRAILQVGVFFLQHISKLDLISCIWFQVCIEGNIASGRFLLTVHFKAGPYIFYMISGLYWGQYCKWAFSSYSTFQSWTLYLVYDFRFVLRAILQVARPSFLSTSSAFLALLRYFISVFQNIALLKGITRWWTLVKLCHDSQTFTAVYMDRPFSTHLLALGLLVF